MFTERAVATTTIAAAGTIIPGVIAMERDAVIAIQAAFGFRFHSAIRMAWVAVIFTKADIGCPTRGIIMFMASVAVIITTIVFGGIILACIPISKDADIIPMGGVGSIFRRLTFIRRLAGTYTMA